MKKYFWFITGTTLTLFLIGFLIGPFVVQWTAKIIGKEIVGFTISDWLVPPFSLGMLLAFCSICAGCLLWAYSRSRFAYPPRLVFGFGLLGSLLIAAVSIGFKLLQMRFVFKLPGDNLNNIPIAMRAINYFSLGFSLTLLVNIIVIVILLWFSRQGQEQKDNSVPAHNN